MTMDNCVCIKCGESKFPVFIDSQNFVFFRCPNCEKTMDDVLENYGYMIKGVNKE